MLWALPRHGTKSVLPRELQWWAVIRIRFEPSGREVEVEGPEALLDVVDELPGTQVRLSCRSAHCGACLVKVEAGESSLTPAARDELTTLASLGQPAGHRLACQLRLLHDASERVVLRAVG